MKLTSMLSWICAFGFLQALTTQAGTIHTAPAISVVGAFYSGGAPRKRQRLLDFPIAPIRDGLRWKDVERSQGTFGFEIESAASLSTLAARDLLGPIMVLPQTPLYHAGKTVTLKKDIKAFAQYVRAAADHFPDSSIEIGNEFNGGAFVSGPARRMTPVQRAALHAQMLKHVTQAGVAPQRIIGGALHSMAGGYLWALLDTSAAQHMGALAIHPYTTAPEAFPRQMAFLRRHPEMQGLPVDVTEFGIRDPNRATSFFWKYYCQMALADVRQAFWYPLDAHKDGYVPMMNNRLEVTPLGHALTYAAAHLAGKPTRAIKPDPFTYGCLFGDRVLVLWGAARAVFFRRDDLIFRNGNGQALEAMPALSRTDVTVIEVPEGNPPIDVTRDLVWAKQKVVFDSFDQFDYPRREEAAEDHRSLRVDGVSHAFATCPGQDRPEAPWYPHLCFAALPRAVLHDRGFVLPRKRAAFHTTYVATRDMNLSADIVLDVHQQSRDGVEVALNIGGRNFLRQQVEGAAHISTASFFVQQGMRVTVTLQSGPNTQADQGRFRLTLREVSGS